MKASANKLSELSVHPELPTGTKDLPRRIQVTDGTLALVAIGFGRLEKVKLPAGVYRIRVESTIKPYEEMVFLRPGRGVAVAYPVNDREVLPSAAPVPGADAMHEHMRDPLDRVVSQSPSKDKPCRIVFMSTAPTSNGRVIDFSGFRLVDSSGSQEGNMEPDAVTDMANLWKIFSKDVLAGGWIVESPADDFGLRKRFRQPIWCAAGWTTLIFTAIKQDTGRPDMANTSVYYWRTGRSFAPENRSTIGEWQTAEILRSQRYTELALHSLINGRSLLSIEEVDTELLVEKFSNPMLGILGCHLLLRRPKKSQELIATVLSNLDTLVPGHPDVTALFLIARRAGIKGLKNRLPKLSWPPMLRLGFLAVRAEDWRKPGSILPASLFDRVRTRTFSGGVWTRWLGDRGYSDLAQVTEKQSPLIITKRIVRWKKVAASSIPTLMSEEVAAFSKRFTSSTGRELRVKDLEWTGMSSTQASAALVHLADKSKDLQERRKKNLA